MAFGKRRRRSLHCSFCGRDEKAVPTLIAGPAVHICGDCVGRCNDILAGHPTAGFTHWEAMDETTLLAALAPSERAAEALRGVLQRQVDILRGRGVSWAAIGEALGVSRQAAWERFG
jgi:hypothetical protein